MKGKGAQGFCRVYDEIHTFFLMAQCITVHLDHLMWQQVGQRLLLW